MLIWAIFGINIKLPDKISCNLRFGHSNSILSNFKQLKCVGVVNLDLWQDLIFGGLMTLGTGFSGRPCPCADYSFG